MARAYMWSLAKYSLLGAAAYLLYRMPDVLCRLPTSCLTCSEAEKDPHRADRVSKVRIIIELQETPGVKFVGALRIPNSDDENHKDVDLVILIRRKLYLVEVKNCSGKLKLETDGCWCQKHEDGSLVKHGNVFEEVKKRAALLELYLLRRGLKLSSNFVQSVIVLANADCRVDASILGIPGVFTIEQWKAFLKRKPQKISINWMIPSKQPHSTSSLHQQLNCVLKTAPTWDRITFQEGGIVFGSFLAFNGTPDDMEVLKSVKRSRVSTVSIKSQAEHINFLGFQVTTAVSAQVTCTLRDYSKNVSKRENKENADEPTKWFAKVRGDTMVIFQEAGGITPEMFTLSNVVVIQLSA